MILTYLLFLAYCLLAGYWVINLHFVRSSGLNTGTLTALFIIKLAAAVVIGWISATWYAQGNDYWTLNREGWLEHQALLNNPKKFLTDIFQSPYIDKYGGFFDSVGSYWNDLKNNIIIKILALLNFLSGGNYYINSIFFNTFSFIGTAALAKVFLHISNRNKMAVITGCFLIPTTLYFSSGIHKDLVVFTMLGFYVYALFFLLKKSFDFKRFILFIISALLLLLMRNIVLLLVIPPSLFLYLQYKRKWKKQKLN